MGKIRVLPETIASKIAAGEVVERPASVVKELVENALDARATRIRVDLEDGGKTLIRVNDNGDGMAPDDATLAVQRHATSKIATLDDLAAISTLGFRGEALPSISAVSKMRILTCDGNGPGTEVHCVEGKVKSTNAVGLPRGTAVEVRDLFFNLPARKKFLKSDGVEFIQCQRLLHLYALAYDRVAFQLTHSGKLAFTTGGNGWDINLMRGVFERGIAEQLHAFHAETDVGKVRGYISPPHVTTKTARYLYCFVNQRPVRTASLLPWIREALRYTLPATELPYLILFLDVAPEKVDVNVHPAKWEVRFSDALEGRSLVVNGIKEGLLHARKPERAVFDRSSAPPPPVIRPADAPTVESIAPAAPVLETRPLVPSPPDPDHRLVGQVFDTYIAVEEGEDFLLLDQHVVSERALFEALTTPRAIPAQDLLLPLEVPLSEAERAVIADSLALLEKVGIRFRDQESGLVLTALPFYLPPGKAAEQIQEMADQLAQSSDLSLTHLDERLRTMSCKLAIKANTPLSLKEMARLYRLWKEATNQHTCPHGRPIYFRLSKAEMGRHVGRTPFPKK